MFIGHLYAFFANKYIQLPFLLKSWVICHLLLSCKSLSFPREWEVCIAFLLSLGSEQGGVRSGSRSAEHLFRAAVRKPFSHFFLKATIPVMLNPTPVPSAVGASPFPSSAVLHLPAGSYLVSSNDKAGFLLGDCLKSCKPDLTTMLALLSC